MIDVLVPEEQEGTKAVVRAWLKQIGDAVAENDPLVELETDKVTQEVPAPAAGVLAEIVLDTDAEAVPGALLGRISADQYPSVLRRSPEREAEAARLQQRQQRTPFDLAQDERSVGNPPQPLRPPRLPAAWHRPVPHHGHRP